MTYVQIVEGGVVMDKYVPDQCDCGKFLNKYGECNSCGMVRCNGCGRMLDYGESCEYCDPKEYLEQLEEDIKICQHDNEVKSCKECDNHGDCYYNDERRSIERRIKEK